MLDYAALKTATQSESQRSDAIPADVMRRMSDESTQRINRRLNLALAPLIADTDTNEILTNHDLIYLAAMMEVYSRWNRDWEDAMYYDERFGLACSDYQVMNNQEQIDNEEQNPVVKSERQQAVEAEL